MEQPSKMQVALSEGKAVLTAILKDAEGNITQHKEEYAVQYAPGMEDGALFQILTQVRMSGGFTRRIAEGHIEFIPFSRAHSVELELSRVSLAVGTDLGKLGSLPNNRR